MFSRLPGWNRITRRPDCLGCNPKQPKQSPGGPQLKHIGRVRIIGLQGIVGWVERSKDTLSIPSRSKSRQPVNMNSDVLIIVPVMPIQQGEANLGEASGQTDLHRRVLMPHFIDLRSLPQPLQNRPRHRPVHISAAQREQRHQPRSVRRRGHAPVLLDHPVENGPPSVARPEDTLEHSSPRRQRPGQVPAGRGPVGQVGAARILEQSRGGEQGVRQGAAGQAGEQPAQQLAELLLFQHLERLLIPINIRDHLSASLEMLQHQGCCHHWYRGVKPPDGSGLDDCSSVNWGLQAKKWSQPRGKLDRDHRHTGRHCPDQFGGIGHRRLLMQLRQGGQDTPHKSGQASCGKQHRRRGAQHSREQGDHTGPQRGGETSQQHQGHLLEGRSILRISERCRQRRAGQGRTGSIDRVRPLKSPRITQNSLRHPLRSCRRRRRPRLHVRVLPQHPRLRAHLTALRRAHHHMRWVRLQHHLDYRACLGATVARVARLPEACNSRRGREKGGPRCQGRERWGGSVRHLQSQPRGPLVILRQRRPATTSCNGPHCGHRGRWPLHLRARDHQLLSGLLVGIGQVMQSCSSAGQR
mmetsp:Transcript_26729/g.61059  ORF Transcript_26729/g.61059 Transcript_26729/m.61059 type:complete len:581 (+) Transcript_26729:730-2472(+)